MHFMNLFISLLKDTCINIIILGATRGENKGPFTYTAIRAAQDGADS